MYAKKMQLRGLGNSLRAINKIVAMKFVAVPCVMSLSIASGSVSWAKDPARATLGRAAVEEDAGDAATPEPVVGAGTDLDAGDGDPPDKEEVIARRAEEKLAAAAAAESAEDGATGEKGDESARAAFNQVVIINRHSLTVYYQLKVGNGGWVNYALAPNWSRTHTVSGIPSIRYDWSFAYGVQYMQYTLLLGSDNEFRRMSNGLGIELLRISGGGVCSNNCRWAFDGECDDGGPGSDYNVCPRGSDCADCGSR